MCPGSIYIPDGDFSHKTLQSIDMPVVVKKVLSLQHGPKI